MALGLFRKTPLERKRYSIDYYDWLDLGEKVFSMAFSPQPVGELEIDAYSIDPDGTRVVFFASYGVNNTEYVVNVKMTSTGGQLKEDEIKFFVEAIDDDDFVVIVEPI